MKIFSTDSIRARDTWVLLLFLAIDQWLKYLAIHGSEAHLGGIWFRFFPNYGLVFSLPVDPLLGTTIVAAATGVILALLISIWRKSRRIDLGLALMATGAVSNVIDRLRFGFVIDWAYFGRWWPIFNLGDVLVAVGVLLYLGRRLR